MTVQEQIAVRANLGRMSDKLYKLNEKNWKARRDFESLYRTVYTEKLLNRRYAKWQQSAAELQAYYEETLAYSELHGIVKLPKPTSLEQ